jgi:hypothetical protein
MAKYTRHFGAAAALAAALTLGACDRGNTRADSPLAQDTALNRDLALAGRDTAAQPQLQDVPAATPSAGTTTPAPTTRTPTPTRRPTTTTPRAPTREPTPRPPSAPVRTSSGNTVTRGGTGGGAVGTVAAGSTLHLTSNQQVCTNTHKEGDNFTATVSSPVSGSNGAVIPSGATVSLTVTRVKRSENANDPIVMEFRVNSISFGQHTYPVDASVASADVQRVRNSTKGNDAKKVVGGAVAGAIIGQILGKNTKSTVIGAAAGGAAGAAAAAATANFEGCVRDGGAITITLQDAVQVRA